LLGYRQGFQRDQTTDAFELLHSLAKGKLPAGKPDRHPLAFCGRNTIPFDPSRAFGLFLKCHTLFHQYINGLPQFTDKKGQCELEKHGKGMFPCWSHYGTSCGRAYGNKSVQNAVVTGI
jgi:hypothetical protein